MLLPFTFAVVPFLVSLTGVSTSDYTLTKPASLVNILDEIKQPEKDFREPEPSASLQYNFPKESEVTLKESPKPKRFVCEGCNPNEQETLKFLQNEGILDKYALATIMGNIKQESDFHANICEGGARINYQHCHRGGYGLIQWTDHSRYRGLGNHAYAKGLNPSTIHGQLSWLVNEPQFKQVVHRFKQPGKSIESYMNSAYTWIGWGIHGARTHFAYNYAKKLSFDS